MEKLNTSYLTLVFRNLPALFEPSLITKINGISTKKHERKYYHHNNLNISEYTQFVVDIASNFLKLYHFEHNNKIWYMDCVRYNLKNEKKGVDSTLAWHCENDNQNNLISVLFYLKKDKGIINGDLQYKDKYNKKQLLNIYSGLTIIMDGRVQHKPQDPYGTGQRDLIVVSFCNY
tara:strand:- start:3613 stop:4137 length:525 start_codon:yes stop_codon:yes gene_type:complete